MKHLPTIKIKVIPHNKQRYNTAGDYFIKNNGNWEIRISELESPDFEFSVLIHELIEFYLVHKRKISISEIEKFDKAYKGSDPGQSPRACYHKEHMFSMKIESFIAKQTGMEMRKYQHCFDNLKF